MELCRIILVDDHSLFRSGMRGLLDRYDGIRVVGEASTGEEFLAMLPATEADVVFMDFAMPGMNGAETTEKALALEPGLKVITLSMFGDENYYSRMVQAGAKGFLMKDSPMDEVSTREIEILVCVCRGLSNQEIADELFISKRTVDKHRANILEKTGCKNTASLVVYAVRHGLVDVL